MSDGMNIILTGANSGIGLEVLRILLQKGNRILAADLRVDRISDLPSDRAIPFQCDICEKGSIDELFDAADREFGKIDMFIANAGYMHFERMDHADWGRIEKMFRTNTISPMYSYRKYLEHLDGRPGIFAMTVSAMGKVGMPGFALYSATKFALNGFQESVRLEKPENVQITCLYPVSTDTAFFDSPVEIEKPFPVQTPDIVARKFVKGIERGKNKVNPSKLFTLASVLFRVLPPVRTLYWKHEKKKFLDYERRLEESKRE